MAVHDYFLLNRSDRNRLEECVREALSRWQREWGAGEPQALEVSIEEGGSGAGEPGLEWCSGRLDQAEMAVSVAFNPAREGLLGVLLGDPRFDGTGGAIAEDLRRSALQGLIGALFAAAGVELRGRAPQWTAETPPAAQTSRGFVTVRCRCRACEFVVLLHPALTRHCMRPVAATETPQRAALHPRRAALGAERVTVDVCVGEAELSLPELASLAVGDVLCLDRRLEQPALVRMEDGATLGAGHLGLRAEYKAIQLAILHDNQEV